MPGLEVLGRETEIVGCLSAFQHNLFKVYVSCIGKTKPMRLAESHAPPRSSAPRTLRCTPSRPGGRRRTARRTPPPTDACDLRRQIRPKKRRVTSIRHRRRPAASLRPVGPVPEGRASETKRSTVSLASRTPDISSSLAPSGVTSRCLTNPGMLAWYVAVEMTSAPPRRNLV